MEKQNASAGSEVLRIEHLTTGYGERKVLDDVSLSVRQGEFIGLIGANGAGKSTLIKCICGLSEMMSGRIWIHGEDNASLTPKKRACHVAVVPQLYNSELEFYSEDIVMMGRNPYHSFRDREKREDSEIVDRAMELTGTAKFKGTMFSNLSGGEQQRVIIARAIAQETELLLLDEPISALDLQHQIEVMELAVGLNKRKGKTIIAVLHDLNLAARYCSRLIMLHEGGILADGTPEEVLVQDYLQKMYSMQMIIRVNPVFSRPEIIPIRVLNREQTEHAKRVHIICGGGSGARVMESLSNCGHRVSIGVVNYGDDDWIMGRYLGIEMVTAEQFSDVTSKAQDENLIEIFKSDILYIANVPVGTCNLENLRGLENYDGTIVIHKGILDNDFTPDKQATQKILALAERSSVRWIDDDSSPEMILDSQQ